MCIYRQVVRKLNTLCSLTFQSCFFLLEIFMELVSVELGCKAWKLLCPMTVAPHARQQQNIPYLDMSHFSYACKTEGENGISCLISALCVNCLRAILEYSRIIDHSIIWMCIWCGLLQKLHKIKKFEHLNSKVSFKL